MRALLCQISLIALTVAACTEANFVSNNSKAQKSADAATQPNGTPSPTNPEGPTSPSPSSGPSTTPTTDQNTVYVPVGGTKSTGVPGACTSADDTIATCANGTVTGVKVGTTTATAGGPGSSSGATTKVVVYDPNNPPPGIGSNSGTAGGIDSANSTQQAPGIDGGTVTQTTANTIVFGGTKLFHLGDGNYDQSTCSSEINQITAAFAQFYFQFQVVDANTNVTVTFGQVCGVDYKYSNSVSVLDSTGATLGTQVLTPNTGNVAYSVPVNVTGLSPGMYQIVITSNNCDPTKEGTDANGNNFCTPGVNGGPTDRDDYVVGNVTVTGTNPVMPGAEGTQQATN